MTGPEHYREAERIAAAAMSAERAGAEGFTGWHRDELSALAQVHATLALIAATVNVSTEDAPLAPPPSGWTTEGNELTWAEATR